MDAKVKAKKWWRQPNPRRLNQRGQIAVEYILLLIAGVAIWLLLVNGLVSRNPESPGIVIKKWGQIIEWIASDQ